MDLDRSDAVNSCWHGPRECSGCAYFRAYYQHARIDWRFTACLLAVYLPAVLLGNWLG